MYKSKLFMAFTILTFILLCVVVYFQFEEMKTYGMLYSMMQDAP